VSYVITLLYKLTVLFSCSFFTGASSFFGGDTGVDILFVEGKGETIGLLFKLNIISTASSAFLAPLCMASLASEEEKLMELESYQQIPTNPMLSIITCNKSASIFVLYQTTHNMKIRRNEFLSFKNHLPESVLLV
jgi:hypothetical protein